MNVKTAHGNVHSLTVGREFQHRGYTRTNVEGRAAGKADCGVLTSSAARVTNESVNCPKCGR